MNTPRIAFAAALAALLTAPGAWSVEDAAPGPAQLTLDDLRTFADAFNQIRQNYVEPVDDRTLLNAAIEGMLLELDPHSAFLQPDAFRDLDNESRGRYGGIGVEVRFIEGRIEVIAAVDGGPAQAAGMQTGDFITAVNGDRVDRNRPQSSMEALQGEPGTDVLVEYRRPGEGTREVTLTRAFVPLPTVAAGLLDEHYGYLRVSQFHRGSAEEFEREFGKLVDEHGAPLQGVILDLRNNPGGVLTPAVEIADGFLDDGLIVYTEGRHESAQLEFNAHPGDWAEGAPMVVLVDRGSASASEVLAGALQDHGRALVVGDRTFGKGSVQSVLTMRNGSALKLTTSRYFTPAGRSIQAEGIEPDVEIPALEVKASESRRGRREADLPRRLDNPNGAAAARVSDVNPEEDYALYHALSLLKGARAFGQSRPAPAELQARRAEESAED
ncbi:MAG: S41 family peptidase [Xanthomonadales bacterium]|nr:S41 family peptidase [Xanthomonadales bacterium]